MTGGEVVIFKRGQEKKLQKNAEDLDGDSGVGQAPEFPSRSFNKKTSPSRKEPRFSSSAKLLSKLGTLLIIFSILGFSFTYGPIIKTELGYRLDKLMNEKRVKGSFGEILAKSLSGEIENVPDPNFSLIIPKIRAKGKIIANVDPQNETEYFNALKVGIAHAKGTYFPGDRGNIYLFAHSTDSPLNIIRYNAVFYLLRELEAGDEIQVYFGGVKHRYSVSQKKIVEPTDVSYLSPDNPENQEQLILQTCWPPGTRLKRLLVFAQKITSLEK